MSNLEQNPYQPPQADLAGAVAHGEYAETGVFNKMTRIGRLRYLAYSMAVAVVGYAILAMPLIAIGSASDPENPFGGLGMLSGALLVAGYVFFLVMSIVLAIRRFHDLGRSGWFSILVFVPLLNLFAMLYLWFGRGDEQANEFGPPPPPNPRGMALVAIVPLLFFVLGILAAIAIPAYQGYVEQASQSLGSQ